MSAPNTDEWGLVQSEQEESEESYFVSMTDIMVGLLFIFIIMLMAFGLMLKIAVKDTEQTRDNVREVVRQSRDEVKQIRDVDGFRAKMLEDIEVRLRKKGIHVIVREENGVLQLPDEILFDKAESKLNARGIRAMRFLAEALDVVLPCYANLAKGKGHTRCPAGIVSDLRLEAIFVEGHTDSDGSQDYNWSLSVNRAINTYRALEEHSSVATHLKNDLGQFLFSVAGYGENRPVVRELTEQNKRQNRRIDLRFVMYVSHDKALDRVQKRLEKVLQVP